MDIWSNLKVYEEQIREKISEEQSEIVELIREAFAHYILGISKLPELDSQEQTLVRIGLITENLNYLRISFYSATRGYYLQSISLLRNVYQNWLAFWYLIQFPDDAHFWLDPSWKKRPPKTDTMRRKMEHPSPESSNKIHELATELHRFAHTDPVIVLNQLKEIENHIIIQVGPKNNLETFKAFAHAHSIWIGHMLDAVDSLIPGEIEWRETHCVLRDRILQYMEEYNSQFEGS